MFAVKTQTEALQFPQVLTPEPIGLGCTQLQKVPRGLLQGKPLAMHIYSADS